MSTATTLIRTEAEQLSEIIALQNDIARARKQAVGMARKIAELTAEISRLRDEIGATRGRVDEHGGLLSALEERVETNRSGGKR